MSATYEYGPRDSMPPVTMTWYQGVMKPQIWTDGGIPQWSDACLFIGSDGMLLADYGRHVLLPEDRFAGFRQPDPTIPRSPGHQAEWVAACKSGAPTSADFEYSGWLTEANHLGNVAYRLGQTIEWDAEHLRATNAPEADPLIKREYRRGWTLV
ncbi:MAG: hypothetical protein JNG89_21060 [Planctomycetaceae bacterium]|nr:hypothetical protein [Planctomycetaceae bacterium]